MSLLRFQGSNHPQQVDARGAVEDVDDRGTTPEVFDPLMERFGFTLDVAASAHNAKVPRYFTRDDDGLAQPWGGERVWCNPPYSAISTWVEKAWAEWTDARLIQPGVIVMLVPANRTEQRWWQQMVEPHRDLPRHPLRTEFIAGRLRFIRHGAGHDKVMPNERPPFGCVLLIWSHP